MLSLKQVLCFLKESTSFTFKEIYLFLIYSVLETRKESWEERHNSYTRFGKNFQLLTLSLTFLENLLNFQEQ